MKKIAILLSFIIVLTSCDDRESVIEGNPVVDQININDNGNAYKYEVFFKTKTNSAINSKMETNFRYQVGDTLISFYEFFDVKMNGLRDSVKFYKNTIEQLKQENFKLKTTLDLILEKTTEKKENK